MDKEGENVRKVTCTLQTKVRSKDLISRCSFHSLKEQGAIGRIAAAAAASVVV